ncbi:MAG: PD40 domain-containing protein [Anaerolineae bacterium]|nr:PD40 domain-containing protein [Anaerolineae bacterium]
MRCTDCGYEVPDELLICPKCGQSLDQTQPMKRRKGRRAASVDETMPILVSQIEEEAAKDATPPLTIWQRLRIVLVALLIFLCLMTISSGVGVYLGARDGEATRIAQEVSMVDQHYRLGLEHMTAAQDQYRLGATQQALNEVEMAIAEFDFVLRLEPDHTQAAEMMREAETFLVILSATPTPTLDPNADLEVELYAQAQAAYTVRDWEEVIDILSQLRAFAPQYETASVEEMLFQSLYNHGMNLLGGDRLEEGLFYMSQAEELRSLDQEALLEVELARRYLAALGYWAVNWEECIQRLEDLYTLAPNYKDVFTRVYQAHVEYGDLWAGRGEMCPAAAQYARAVELTSDPELTQQRDAAAAVCAVATPTPIPPITGTIGITGTVIVPGFNVGRLAYPAYNAQAGMYDIYALTAGGQLTRVTGGADQPSWQWGTDRLIYRDRLAGGISTLQPGGQPLLLRADSGAAWPTLSPDGGRYAYAARDANGFWQIYIAPTNGASEPVLHAAGWEPTWGPAGLLAWTACDDEGVCGIFVDNPDDAEAPRRLTGSINDSGIHWAPSGNLMAYMADHTGTWNIYLLDVSGGVQVVTSGTTLNGLPAWAPDGSSIAFLSYRDEGWGIYLMQPNGENQHKVIELGAEMPGWDNQRLSWSP